jgi:hypothetical protein
MRPKSLHLPHELEPGFLLTRLRQVDIFDDDYVWWPWLVDSRCAHASLSFRVGSRSTFHRLANPFCRPA